jgi:hypothetical protein
MEQVRLDTGQLKALVQEAVAEALEQQKGIIYEAVAEALEDLALVHAIREGDRGDYVSREEIFSILEGAA